MNEPSQPSPAAETPPASSSLTSRLTNVFVVPGEVFQELKAAPHRFTNWLVPILLACLVGIAYTGAIFSTETLARQMREMRDKAIQQKIDSGKIPKQQGQQVIEKMDQIMSPTVMIVLGSLGVVGTSFAWPFFVAVVVWLLGRFAFKAEFAYLKAVEVCGLAGMIGALNQLVRLLLALGVGSLFVTPGPSLLIREFDPQNLLHLAAAAVNLLAIWHVGVVALGLAKLSGVSWARAACWLYALWVLAVGGSVLAGWGVARIQERF